MMSAQKSHRGKKERCKGDESQSRSSRKRGSRKRRTFFFFAFLASRKKEGSELREEAVDVIELTRQSCRE